MEGLKKLGEDPKKPSLESKPPIRAQSARLGAFKQLNTSTTKKPTKNEMPKLMNNNWIKEDEGNSGEEDDFDKFDKNYKPNEGAKNKNQRQIKSAQTCFRPGSASSSSSRQLNVKTLKNITNGECLEITPSEIIFENIEANQPYQTILYVQNLSKMPKRIRVFQPKTKKFSVDYDSSQSLAAGMCGKLIIHFETNVLEEFADEVVIEYEENGSKMRHAVPIFARKPRPLIVYSDFIDLGFVRTSKEVTRIFTFRNEGKQAGRVKLMWEQVKNVKFEPSQFTVQPQSTQQAKLIFKQKESGIYRGQVDVQIEGVQISPKIEISATVVEFNKVILDDDNSQVTSFDFGEVYYGQSKFKSAVLYNNSPKPQKFIVNMKLGIFNPNEDIVTLQTPQDQGKEITDQIMSVSPNTGEIPPYSNIRLRFCCNSVATYEHKVLARKYALSTQDLKVTSQDYSYSALFRFVDDDPKEEPIAIILSVKGTYPLIRLSSQILKFGDCNVNDHRESLLDIENKHTKLPIDVNVERTSCFVTEPAQFSLVPNQKTSFKVSFFPGNVGEYSKDIFFTMLGGIYKIPIKVTGSTQRFDPKKKKERGPECGVEDFVTKDQFLDNQVNQDIFNKKAGAGKGTFEKTTAIQLPKGISQEGEVDANYLAEMQKEKANKKKYDNVLESSRQNRIQKEKQKIIGQRYNQMFDVLKAKGLVEVEEEMTAGPVDNVENIIRGDPKIGAPLDLEFELGLVDPQIEPQELDLPPSKDPLFVLKPIGDYDPVQEEIQKVFDCDPDAPIKKLFPEKPSDPRDIKFINKELSGQELRCIQSGPSIIDFGDIYVNSRVTKTFSIKNDLRDAIRVQLKISAPELKESYQKPQILKSSDIARFQIVLYSEDVDEEYKARVTYVINSKHSYEFEVRAKITQVLLKLNKQQIRCNFLENSTSMETSEQVLIENAGNAPGFFKWDNSSKIFSFSPSEGFCPARSSIPITVTYRPSPGTSIRDTGVRYEEDKVLLQVTNGMNQMAKCIGVVNEAKCSIKQASLDLGQVPVGNNIEKTFTVKNNSRIAAIYQILTESLPEHVSITSPISGKILSDGQMDVGVKFECLNECKIENEIKILIRGGKILRLPFSVETIIPKVSIRESGFNFGKITALGNSSDLELNLVNDSQINANLVLDLRGDNENFSAPDGVDCLNVQPVDKSLDENSFRPVLLDAIDDHNHDAHQDEELSDDGQDDSRLKSARLFNITIKPGQNIKLRLSFSPKAIRSYSFDLPLTLLRYGKIPSLTRNVTCVGLKPKFWVDPQVVEFERKIITSVEHQFPTNSEIILSNPEKRSMSWRLDDTLLEKDKIFSIHPTQGRVDPGQTLRIKTSFNPSYPNYYEKQVPLFIDDPDLPPDQPCCFIVLKGSAAYPKLLFDRREILLPVVPLNTESRCIFYLINDGYDNLSFRHKILEELGQIDIKCNFPEGTTVDVTRTKLKVEIIFSSKKPTSFTSRIEFKDNNSNSYSIPVSGTADNCLLTNFPFMQRNKGGYVFKAENDKSAIQILEERDSDHEDDISIDEPIKPNPELQKRSSVRSNFTSQTKIQLPTSQGYTLIPRDMLDSGRENIRQWLNYFVLPNQIQSFPESVVDSNGDAIFELINYCSGKSIIQFKADIQPTTKKPEKVKLLFKQYDDVARYLKADGALLNHIRPQYLLSFVDYHTYIKSLPPQENSHVSPSYLKINPKIYSYLHFDCWISFFYQILKIYQLNKVNTKIVKSIPNYPADKLNIPDYYLSGSNVFSDREGILLRWLEINCDSTLNSQLNGLLPKRILNLESDLQDGNVISCALQNYIGGSSVNSLSSMKQECASEEDIHLNCEKLSAVFQELKISTQYNPQDLERPSAREVLLFLLQLSAILPYYIPKSAPIIFQCILGEDIVKTIEISNPTSKAVSYSVKYEGSPDFSLDSEESFRIEPKTSFKYRVRFSSRVSNPQTGRITFTNKKDSTTIASALTFDLKSMISGRVSQQVWNIDCSLYECKEFSISVQNKFTNYEYGDFLVTVMHEYEIPKIEEKKEEEPKDAKKKKPLQQQGQGDKKTIKKKKKGDEDEEEEPLALPEFEKLNFPSFFCKTERVKLKRGAVFNLQMAFIPLIFENQKCYIIFNDPKVGEFQHEIRGRVDMPDPIIEIPTEKTISSPITVEVPNTWTIPLTFKNPQLTEAKKYLEQWLVEKPKIIGKNQPAVVQPTNTLTVKQIYQMLSPQTLGYEIEIEQPPANAVTVPKILLLQNPSFKSPPAPIPIPPPAQQINKPEIKKVAPDNKKRPNSAAPSKKVSQTVIPPPNVKKNLKGGNEPKQDDKKSLNSSLSEKNKANSTGNNNQTQLLDSQHGSNEMTSPSQVPIEPENNILQIAFFFKNPFKDYIANIVLKNQQRTDIRRYRLVVSSIPKPIRAALEMTAPARECVVQEIPIINNTDKDWQLKISLTLTNPDDKSFFINQPPVQPRDGSRPASLRDFLIKKKTTGNVPICFYPEWICKSEAKLTISNPLTSDQFDYDLKGIGEAPLAIDHIVIHSRSRTTATQEIVIKNLSDTLATYTVETDLIGAAGESSITIPAQKSGIYLLKVHPVMSGQYTGSITFSKKDGTYIWWTVLLNIDSPQAVKVIDLITNIRKPLVFDIELSNPTSELVTFEVVFEGDGLLGEQYFLIQPQKTAKYELFYMPLKVGKFKGSVAFLSEKLGEIWYELNMEADDSGVVRLPILKCELGKTEQHEITLENPSNEDVKVRVKISNTQNFEVSPETIVIPSYDQVHAYIKYRPSVLDKHQTSEVVFETDNIGKWVYQLYGEGLPPTNFETKIITVGLNKDYSGLLNFKNPFKDPIQVKLFLDTKDAKVLEAIKLIKKPKEVYITIPAMTIYQIPYSFQPREIRFYDCDVVVAMSDKIQWRFPIHAVTESLSSITVQSCKTKCRVKISNSFSLNLPGISDMFNPNDTYQYEIKEVPEDCTKLVKRSLKLRLTKNTLNHPDDHLSFDISFKPYKPFKCTVDLLVLRQSGGLWKFKISLEATQPNEDDLIILSAPLGERDSVSFKLINRFKDFATFRSHFTEGSDSEFSVTPMTGLLEPAGGKNSTQFIITFSPLEYGKIRNGKLIIETEEMYWSYLLKGVLPKYAPPQINQSRYNYKPDYSYMKNREMKIGEEKNFISTNIKNQSVIMPSVKSFKLNTTKNPSAVKGYFNYVPSLAGGEDVLSGISSVNAVNTPNNAQKVFRVQTAKSVKSIKVSSISEEKE